MPEARAASRSTLRGMMVDESDMEVMGEVRSSSAVSSSGCGARDRRPRPGPARRTLVSMRVRYLLLSILLGPAGIRALRQPIGRITSLNRNRLVADEDDSQFYRAPRLVNHADGAA